MNKADVRIDRDKYIGGSDIPVIMGISPFKTRYQLLLEKAGLAEDEFKGNRYTQYGDIMEPKIRDYINKRDKTNFTPSQTIKGDLRANTDGIEGLWILEVKTTSQIHKTVYEYKVYLVQLLFYMLVNNRMYGKLAVYERPEDFNETFDEDRLQEFNIAGRDFIDVTTEIIDEIDKFRADLKRLKANPLLSEQDFQPSEVIVLSKKVIALENQMAAFKKLEAEYKEMRQALFKAMVDHNVKSWEMPNGTKITRIDEKLPIIKTVKEFDVDLFKQEHKQLYEAYTKKVAKETGGKAGYILITPPKEQV